MNTVIETKTGWMIRCEHCQWHEFPKVGKPGASWTFNGNLEKPTFTPSMNEFVNDPASPHHNPGIAPRRCHFIVTDGVIKYCEDCTHSLHGLSMLLEPWPQSQVDYYAALKQSEGW